MRPYLKTKVNQVEQVLDDPDEDLEIFLENEARSDAYPSHPMACDWFNSVGLKVSAETDSVSLLISVSDPRGGLEVRITRRPDGRLVIVHPDPLDNDPFPHVSLARLSPDSIVIVGDSGKPISFRRACNVHNCPDCEAEAEAEE